MDPLTIALQAAPLIFKSIADRKRGNEDLRAAQAAERAALEKREYTVGDAFNQYLAASKQDKAADLQRQIASEQEASAIGALKSGGAKALLGGLGASQRRASQQRMGIEAESQARQQAALKDFATVEQRANEGNVGLASLDVQRAQQQQDDARKLRRGAFDDLVTGGLGLASMIYGSATAAPTDGAKYGMKMQNGGDTFKDIRALYKGGADATSSPLVGSRYDIKENFSGREKRARLRENRIEQRKAINDALKDVSPQAYERRLRRSDAALEAGSEILRKMQTGRREEPFTYDRKSGEMLQEGQKFTLEEFMRMSQGLGGGTGSGQGTAGGREFGGGSASNIEPVTDGNGDVVKNDQGQILYKDKVTGETKYFKKGGVQKTPGEFSHAKNPIDIMKDGAKIGEMTGGEYIFNPRQASTLQSLASKGSSPLHKYVRNLLQEFDKR